MNTTISVITPLYNGKKYIPDIIGMLRQNLKMCNIKLDIELILINDSPDETISKDDDVLHVEEFKVVLLTNTENMGIHYSRVRGLKHAVGQYIVFFDQDDRIEDNYFCSQIKHIRNADVVVANGIAQCPNYEKILYRYQIMQWTVKHLWFYAKFNCRIISPGQCLIKRDSIPSIWKENILRNNGADDYFLWLVMLSHKKQFAINRKRVYTHVYTAVNVSGNSKTMHNSVEEMLFIIKSVLRKRYIRIIENRSRNAGRQCFLSVMVQLVERINRVAQ